MKELTIKSVEYKKYPHKRTLKEFNEGADEFCYKIIVTTNIPSDYNPMAPEQQNENFFCKGSGEERVEIFNKVGYHMSDDDLVLESFKYFNTNKTRNLKMYY